MTDFGLVADLNPREYHASPGLSVSGAKKLLPPSCPAKFRHEQIHGRPPTDAFDFGHVAHALVLGVGEKYARLDFPDRRTKAYREAADEARANGQVPILEKAYRAAEKMAAEVHRHKVAGRLLANGKPEQSAFVTDEQTGTPLRARFDWVTDDLIVDYKTAESADPAKWVRSAADYGYHMQDAWYTDTAARLGLPDRLLFIVQEKSAPYLVSVIHLDDMARIVGAHRNRQAINLYAKCEAEGYWPGYGDGVTELSLPAWVESQYVDEFAPSEIEV